MGSHLCRVSGSAPTGAGLPAHGAGRAAVGRRWELLGAIEGDLAGSAPVSPPPRAKGSTPLGVGLPARGSRPLLVEGSAPSGAGLAAHEVYPLHGKGSAPSGAGLPTHGVKLAAARAEREAQMVAKMAVGAAARMAKVGNLAMHVKASCASMEVPCSPSSVASGTSSKGSDSA